LNEEISKSSRR